MEIPLRKTMTRWLLGSLGLALVGCSTADNEMAGGNLQAVNHTLHTINWFSVNGYRAHGGGGSSCCIILPIKWRPGLKASIEWEVDPEPFAESPPLGTNEFREFMKTHKAKYRHYSTIVDIPEWQGTESCDLKVHFLTCNKVKVTTSCWGYGSPNNPIKEPQDMKEPVVCPK
ncbi:DUF3304 domain-containing protein [Pseudomonas sp. Pseusp16]|uniref:DUF3304 domain-containing protein n=1 Tax=Pseudomonas sp. Pseusp16 TaxID=3243021 RepID=UPI0039B4DC3F